jgi:hypothetical protein
MSKASLLAAALGLGAVACSLSHENGQVFTTDEVDRPQEVYGYVDQPGKEVVVELLSSPEDPATEANWVVVGRGRSSTTPTKLGDPERPAYQWSATFTPRASHWPRGGLLRVRLRYAGSTSSSSLNMFESLACVFQHWNAGESWVSAGSACASPFTGQPMMWVSTIDTPTQGLPLLTPPYLTRNLYGTGSDFAMSETETAAYYGDTGLPGTLDDFERRYQIKRADGTVAPETVRAVYYNDADLGFGREMACRDDGRHIACAVSNYGDPGINATQGLARAVAGYDSGRHAGPVATVVMVYDRQAPADERVQFGVYDDVGQPALEAKLDNRGPNLSIPGNCMSCHGGKSTYDDTDRRRRARGAAFLPFDPASFRYSTDPRFTRAAQEQALRRLNELVARTRPPAATTELISLWYGDVTVPGPAATDAIPAGWDRNAADRLVYREVVAPYCRTCHVSFPDGPDFNTAAEFKLYQGLVVTFTRGNGSSSDWLRRPSHLMPHAERTLAKFWASSARAYLAQYFKASGSWKP